MKHQSEQRSAQALRASLRTRVSWRRASAFTYDVAAVVASWSLALLFRFSFDANAVLETSVPLSIAWVAPIYAASFVAFGLYRGIWYFASLPDLIRLGKAVAVGTTVAVAVAAMTGMIGSIPRSVFLLLPVFTLVLMGSARLAYRALKEHLEVRSGQFAQARKPVIVLGAGVYAASLIKDLARSSEWRVVGLLDDARAKIGNELLGHRVLGPITDLPRWSRALGARDAIIAIPSAGPKRRAEIVRLCLDAGIHGMSVPSISEMLAGGVKATSLREISLEDLVGRSAVDIDSGSVAELLRGKSVMITGAGGSIGSELCRQIARFEPAQMILLETSEFALYKIDEELRESFPDVQVVPLTCDVKDGQSIDHIFTRYSASIVFHAAAYKHVPLMEERNAWAAVRNNAFGTYQLATHCIKHHVKRFVFVSTDKAVNPTNVMGATKRLAELICLDLQCRQSGTQFEVVRFGNVIGSAGSAIPKFQAQIAKGGPVTVTHPEITRYFMSIPEASQLVLQAACMGRGGEVFVLDMGEPLKVVDLARNLIRLSGRGEDTIKIVFTGLRPGEKLYEELLADAETTRETHHAKVRIAVSHAGNAAMVDDLINWLTRNVPLRDEEVRRDLHRFVPEYSAPRPRLLPVAGGALEVTVRQA